jgi:hypothetical protein
VSRTGFTFLSAVATAIVLLSHSRILARDLPVGPAGQHVTVHPRAFECAAKDADHTPLAERTRAHGHRVAHVHGETHQELEPGRHVLMGRRP